MLTPQLTECTQLQWQYAAAGAHTAAPMLQALGTAVHTTLQQKSQQATHHSCRFRCQAHTALHSTKSSSVCQPASAAVQGVCLRRPLSASGVPPAAQAGGCRPRQTWCGVVRGAGGSRVSPARCQSHQT